jgi:inorganic pyrophosphatase
MAEVDVIIEISKGGHIKYEYDKDKKILICDRILHTPMKYPFNYGFIPNTLSEDGDPLDVVVLMEDELTPGCMIRCKLLGYLDTKDESGYDPKVIVCPIEKIDPIWRNINNLYNLININTDYYNSLLENKMDNKLEKNTHILLKIKYFFQHYKDLENKYVIVGDFHNLTETLNVYNDSLLRYKNKGIQKNKITNYFERT